MPYRITKSIVADGVPFTAGDVADVGEIEPGCLASMLRLGQAVPITAAEAAAPPVVADVQAPVEVRTVRTCDESPAVPITAAEPTDAAGDLDQLVADLELETAAEQSPLSGGAIPPAVSGPAHPPALQAKPKKK
jgi:hypothetical protein